MTALELLENETLKRYKPNEIPSTLALCAEWKKTRPLEGLRVLDATPLFFNTFSKYMTLLHGGADLTVGYSSLMPHDSGAADFLRMAGVNLINCDANDEPFDIVLDNAAVNVNRESRYGYVELTRSGVHRYRDAGKKVFLADSSRIKAIETCLGTGEGCLRALRESGHSDIRGTRTVVFGYGRVGFGIAMYFNGAGSNVEAVDISSDTNFAPYVKGITFGDRKSVLDAVEKADFIISATGLPNALAEYAKELASSKAMLINMGVEDEFGSDVPLNRVENSKMSYNFILEEPTRLRYIEPTLALHSYGAELLAKNMLTELVNVPTTEMESKFLSEIEKAALITDEIKEMGL